MTEEEFNEFFDEANEHLLESLEASDDIDKRNERARAIKKEAEEHIKRIQKELQEENARKWREQEEKKNKKEKAIIALGFGTLACIVCSATACVEAGISLWLDIPFALLVFFIARTIYRGIDE